MGALAADSSWTTEDDVKLKNAVETGVSLESLAKGDLQFSRRFTVLELQGRWHALLYDPVVSAVASARMLEFEHFASVPTSKSNHVDHTEEKISVSGKRKAESVRRRFYAMRKRIRDQHLISLDLGFPDAALSINAIRNEEPHPAADFLAAEPVQNSKATGFLYYEAAGDAGTNDVIGNAVFPGVQKCSRDDNSVEPNGIACMVSDTFQHDISGMGNSPPIDELDDFKEIYDLLEEEGTELPATTSQTYIDKLSEYSEFGGGHTLPLPLPASGPAMQTPGSPFTLPEMPVWKTSEGPSTFPAIHVEERQQDVGRTFIIPGNVHADADKLENVVSGGDAKNKVTSADDYLAELSNTLFDFTIDEDLPLMDADGNMIDKSYIDGFSSLLLDSPGRDAAENITISKKIVAEECLNTHTDACHGEFSMQNQFGREEVNRSEGLLLSSASVMNSKSCNSEVICTLNTEDPEIPSNDDVFLLPLAPSLSLPFLMQRKIVEPSPRSTSKAVRDSSLRWKKDDGVPKQIIGESRCEKSQVSSPIIGSQLRSEILGNNRISQDFPNGDAQHVPCQDSSLHCGDRSQVHRETICCGNPFPTTMKELATKSEQAKHLCNYIGISSEKKAIESDNVLNFPQIDATVSHHNMHALPAIQRREALHVEIGCSEGPTENLVVRHSPEEEEFTSLSDDDIPNFSDVEAMVLGVDLSPDDRNVCLNETESSHCLPTLKYKHAFIQKRIIRSEQAADACVRRDMTSRGAFAYLQGRRMKYYIKKPEVLLGRATEDNNVDIDLGRESRTSRVSRRQAIIHMDQEGSFHIKNLSRYPIYVNSVELATGKSIDLTASCLIEIRGLPFLFETNQTCIKQYLDSISNRS